MLPLKIAILWHKHQPYYKKDGEFLMPWTRLHGVKDYFDLPEILHNFPRIKQTFNLVPSLTMQIEEYITGATSDRVQRLTRLDAGKLALTEKEEILRLFFMCNLENMILPYPRYKELHEKAAIKDFAMKTFAEQDWRDLQVWYNLAWFGEFSRKASAVQRHFIKGRDFTEEEKLFILEQQTEILKKIEPQLIALKKLGQVEVSISPMYHPILPLLCNSHSAEEAIPKISMPAPVFQYPEDARSQVENSIHHFEKIFGEKPKGMWPSEGSISDEALEIMLKAGLKWVASDEQVLFETFQGTFRQTEKFFPRKFHTQSGDISILFRDHFLSDRIGFVYSQWQPFDAANDFCHHLHNIRNEIIRVHGDEALTHAVVPIILDAENCWEYYKENGVPFLTELFIQLSNDNLFETVTFNDAVSGSHSEFLPPLKHVRAGSWINADFHIWIGNEDNRKAWSLLSQARQSVEDTKIKLPPDVYRSAMEEIYIAEGSDWFWWYCEEHNAENKDEFDILFRWHLEQVYKHIGISPPEDILIPVSKQKSRVQIMHQRGPVHPGIDGKIHPEPEWDNAGYYDAKAAMTTMHQVGEILKRLWFASDDSNIYFRLDTLRKLQPNERIELHFLSPKYFSIILKYNGFEIDCEEKLYLLNFVFACDEIIEFAFSKVMIFDEAHPKTSLELRINTKVQDGELTYPRQGKIEIEIM